MVVTGPATQLKLNRHESKMNLLRANRRLRSTLCGMNHAHSR